jgi:hypothetical protein
MVIFYLFSDISLTQEFRALAKVSQMRGASRFEHQSVREVHEERRNCEVTKQMGRYVATLT